MSQLWCETGAISLCIPRTTYFLFHAPFFVLLHILPSCSPFSFLLLRFCLWHLVSPMLYLTHAPTPFSTLENRSFLLSDSLCFTLTAIWRLCPLHHFSLPCSSCPIRGNFFSCRRDYDPRVQLAFLPFLIGRQAFFPPLPFQQVNCLPAPRSIGLRAVSISCCWSLEIALIGNRSRLSAAFLREISNTGALLGRGGKEKQISMTQSERVRGVQLSFACDPSESRTLEAAALQEIIVNVAQRPRVASLSLKGNCLSAAAVRLLGAWLESSARLGALDLSMCGLGDRHAISLVRCICSAPSHGRAATSLVALDLSMNFISPEGAARIAHLLAQAPRCTLRDLTLKFNPIKCAGVVALCRMQVPLEVLDCRFCALDVASRERDLLRGLRESRSLREIFLGGNGMTEAHRERIATSLKTATQSRLTSDTVHLGAGPGPLPALELFLSRSPPPSHMAVPAYPPEVVAEVARVDGEIAVVRGKLRDVSAAAPARPSRSGRRIAAVEVSPCAVSSRSASVAADRRSASRAASVGRNADRCVFDASDAPIIRRRIAVRECSTQSAAEPDNNNNNNSSDEKARDQEPSVVISPDDGLADTGAYCKPPTPKLIASAVTAQSRARGRQLHAELRQQQQAKEEAAALPLRKGQAARMLLDRCVINDEQCVAILNLPSTFELQAGRGARVGVPTALQEFDGTPSYLERLPLGSPERIGGIAKILFCVLHAPGARSSLAALREMSDLPTSLRACGSAEAIASFRAQRRRENRDARQHVERLEAATAAGATPTSNILAVGSSDCRGVGGVRRSSSAANLRQRPRYLDFYRQSSFVGGSSTMPPHGSSPA